MKRLPGAISGMVVLVVIATLIGLIPGSAKAAIHPNTFAVVTNQFTNQATVVDLTVTPHEFNPVSFTAGIANAFDVAVIRH